MSTLEFVKEDRLNAPFGAQCFPTKDRPFARGAGCTSQCTFWCSVLSDKITVGLEWSDPRVSMHLLVLSAFRRKTMGMARVLSSSQSQCTFWCSVLSDSASRKPRRNAVSRDENAADLESTKSNRLAPLQLNHTTPENRHKSTQRRQHPLPIGTPPAFNEPTPKDRSLATPPR